jgi:hypothetical protein
MAYVASISAVHAATIFRVEVCRLVNFCVCISFGFEKQWEKVGDGVGIGASSGPIRTLY